MVEKHRYSSYRIGIFNVVRYQNKPMSYTDFRTALDAINSDIERYRGYGKLEWVAEAEKYRKWLIECFMYDMAKQG